MQKYHSGKISKIKGVLKILPVTGTAFMLGLFAIAGTPPFSVFASKFNIILSAFENHTPILGVLLVTLLSIVFMGIVLNLFRMFYGDRGTQDLKPGEFNIPGTAAIVLLLLVISISGIYIPNELGDLIIKAQTIILGG